MAENSAIEWTDHTFNPWIGCAHVGPGCDHCYAEALMDKRHGRARWGGPGKGVGTRVRTAASTWKKPLAWERNASLYSALSDRRQRVFCASLADVFDNAAPDEWRADLAALILATPSLDWLLLTKRIGNARGMLEAMFPGGMPANVWLGATVVNQAEADRDVPKLLAAKGALGISVAFLSMEPLLGPVDLTRAWDGETALDPECWGDCAHCEKGYPPLFNCRKRESPDAERGRSGLDWIIVGGESGPGARPMHPDWARSLRDQCEAAGVPFLFKQWGEFAPDQIGPHDPRSISFPPDHVEFLRVGKKAAGRKLEGVEHNGFPEARHGR